MTAIEYAHIALVEDDQSLATLTSDFLTREGYRVTHYAEGASALKHIPEAKPDCVLLDIMLPGLDGIELCRQLRSRYSGPVIFLTAKGEALDEILGLEVGGDAYLAKPIEPRRLLAHLRAQLRRTATPTTTETESTSVFRIDEQRECIYLNDDPLSLSNPEYRLLQLLLGSEQRVINRDDIMLAVRGIEHDGISRTVDILISDLRKKLPDADWIKTIRGKGYLWEGPQ
ncbi:response regulator transcription factor [Reinekea blandensis]|uniref:Probable two-component response regulator n=1 Tax=Reinekea blandensis MED297 TaxID=314283 RepID=A4B9H2_9GAMM|nr:response regulator transcription factor [Reinekea blandensis]EAR11273.1 probable two-component response regulator [Reinekea sp. MED297] [Reinekea blandensis MED297]